MGCAASSEAREARAANPTQPAPCVWLRILRLDNVPDSDASPFKHGDYYCKPVLETQGASLEGACLTSSYGRGHFQPVSARENVKFDRMVRFSLPRAWGDLDAARLVCKIFDKDVLTADDLIGQVHVPGRCLREKADTEEVVAVGVELQPGLRTENGGATTLFFKVYSKAMGDAINALDGWFESKVALVGELQVLSEMQILWENFFATLFPYEGNRPCMSWVATVGGEKFVCALTSLGKNRELFPSTMAPTHNALEAVRLMLRYCSGAADPSTPVMQVGGLPVSASDLQRRLEAILAVEVPEHQCEIPAATHRLGMVGGMGPVAGAELAVDVSGRLAEARGAKSSIRSGWQVCMLSDPAIETWKNEKIEGWKSVRSSVDMFEYLGRDEFNFTCIGSNTAHLMLQPSPPTNMLSIFEAVSQVIKSEYPGKKVALMCTDLSMKYVDMGYGEIFKKHGLTFIPPTPQIQKLCMDGIKHVKNPTEGAASFRKAIDCFMQCVLWYLDEGGASVFALACTEIPVVLKESVMRSDPRVAGREIYIVDSVAALGKTVVQELMREEEAAASQLKPSN